MTDTQCTKASKLRGSTVGTAGLSLQGQAQSCPSPCSNLHPIEDDKVHQKATSEKGA